MALAQSRSRNMISEETKLKDLSQTDYCILLQVENTFFAIDGCNFFENSPTILFTPPHSLTAESTLPISNSWCVRNTAPYKSIIEVNPGLAVSQTNNYSDGNDIPYDYRYKDTKCSSRYTMYYYS